MTERGKSIVKIVLRLAAAAGVVTAGWLLFRADGPRLFSDTARYEITVVEPTCTEGGYARYTHRKTGEVTVREETAPLGHAFGAWETAEGGTLLERSRRVCTRCGEEEERDFCTEPIAALFFDDMAAENLDKYVSIPAQASYADGTVSFTAAAAVLAQGHGTLLQEKKNLMVRFYDDLTVQNPVRVCLFGDRKEYKYVLKANASDSSMCRNLTVSALWAELVSGRENLPTKLRTSPNYGAVAGYPAAVFIDHAFHGLYTLNLHKDDDLFHLKNGVRDGVLILNRDGDNPAARFRAPIDWTDETYWEVEACGTEKDDAWLRDKADALVSFVMNADGETFRQEIGTYLDTDAALDYLLALWVYGLPTHGREDLIFAVYDDGVLIPSLYACGDAFGLSDDGTFFADAAAFLPEPAGELWDSGTDSLLWDRLYTGFSRELSARYTELRETVFTEEHILACLDSFTARIPEAVYRADAEQWEYTFSAEENIAQISAYLAERLPLLDGILLGNAE